MAYTNLNVTISIDPESMAKLEDLQARLAEISEFDIVETVDETTEVEVTGLLWPVFFGAFFGSAVGVVLVVVGAWLVSL